ncbi:GNAT family N-acetyltransferase [uncultured Phycicoccus sp.]|uniref:GNAT family N-acetyltransferase n=1 Tax=uncultured Phycicoccus sp. TaxID=661422 RepID=UPI00263270B3|nr:GNAT family N-acetyltransferase [uncultured Phycicoccus sp.]
MPSLVTVRPRRPTDLPVLRELLAAQQAGSGYPVRWPLPFPVEEFLVRPGELGGWVALVGTRVVGHVALLEVRPGWEADGWAAGTGRPPERLAAVAVLFVAPGHGGRGIGTRLLDTAVARARHLGRLPVLDVVQEHSIAADLYRRRGWTVVGEARPPWLPPDRRPVLLMALDGPPG